MHYWFLKFVSFGLLLISFSSAVLAQPGKITIDLQKDKPTKYKTKTLKSEKTGEKKFTFPRRVMQNTVSHYNYYFNANNKINEVIERARLGNNEVYHKLLPFYSYSLKSTSAQAAELDSVIYKATAGVLLHDLRSAWVDNFYLLIGKAYLLKNDFDSASMTFQFINYNLYPKNKKDEDAVIVGSNLNNSGNNISIANKENSNLLTKTFSRPPSRNEALVWQIRTFTEMEEYADAAGLMNTLRNDINFPGRLLPALEEVNAYWFYKQGIYDSAAAHLQHALSNASDLQERARTEYLLAQLYQLTKDPLKASQYFNQAIKHTTDPLLDIYANLSEAKMYDSSVANELDKSISHLLRMAKRDKFETYRDIIYYSAGELALEKPDTAAAETYIKKGLSYNLNNIEFKNKSFLKLADISFIRKNYKAAFAYYDSLQTGDTTLTDIKQIQEKRGILSKIVYQINIIEREDSLQKLALMLPADRELFIKKLAKKLRKERGVTDEENPGVPASAAFENKNISSDIFSANTTQGDWYFYNSSAKAKGFTEFKSKWGKRENVDNWRILSANESSGNIANNTRPTDINNSDRNLPGVDNSGDIDAPVNSGDAIPPSTGANESGDISYEGLLENVPVTPEKMMASNTLLSNAIFQLAKLFQSDLEDYRTAVDTYERSLQKYPDSLYGGELYMNLSYCYQKLGDLAKAGYYKNLVTTRFAESKFAKYIKNPKAGLLTAKNPAATKRYEAIYNLFIEGQFARALAEKKAADSIYSNNYWTPQLLFIESVYYIKQKQDSLAIEVLGDIIREYPASLLKSKAERMIDVLERRKEIEDYLTNLSIERLKDDQPVATVETPAPKQVRNDKTIVVKKDSAQKQDIAIVNAPVKKPDVILPVKKDSTSPPASITKPSVPVTKDTSLIPLEENEPPVAVNEEDVSVPALEDEMPASVKEEDTTVPAIKENDIAPLVSKSFNFSPAVPQFVAMLLDKVDPVYISEARNAFVRYNREKFSQKKIDIVKEVIDKDKSLLLFSSFADAAAAEIYTGQIKKDAAVEVSWLPANKYSFFIISEANLQLLKENKDLSGYLKILRNALPGKY